MVHLSFRFSRNKVYGQCFFSDLKADFPPHFHNYYTLGMLLAGCREIKIGKESRRIYPFSPVIINPGDVHSCRQASLEATIWISFTFPAASIFKIFHDKARFANWPSQSRAERLAGILTHWATMPSAWNLLEFFDILSPEKDLKTANQKQGAFAQEAMRSEEWEAFCQLANRRGVNKYAFIRDFKKTMHITPYGYFENLRLLRACHFLEQGKALARCAQEAGYCDQSHLNRHFVKYMGFTPGIFQKAIKDLQSGINE